MGLSQFGSSVRFGLQVGGVRAGDRRPTKAVNSNIGLNPATKNLGRLVSWPLYRSRQRDLAAQLGKMIRAMLEDMVVSRRGGP